MKIKDRILNLLMLFTVFAALGLTLLKTPAAPTEPLPAVTALPAVSWAEAFRQRREETREKEKEALLALPQNPAWSEEIRAAAEAELRQVLLSQETELAVEALLAARGLDDALCVYRQGKLTVFSQSALSEKDAALIRDLAREAAGIDPKNIRISGY